MLFRVECISCLDLLQQGSVLWVVSFNQCRYTKIFVIVLEAIRLGIVPWYMPSSAIIGWDPTLVIVWCSTWFQSVRCSTWFQSVRCSYNFDKRSLSQTAFWSYNKPSFILTWCIQSKHYHHHKWSDHIKIEQRSKAHVAQCLSWQWLNMLYLS